MNILWKILGVKCDVLTVGVFACWWNFYFNFKNCCLVKGYLLELQGI